MKRQVEGESTAPSELALDEETSTHELDELFSDVKAKAGAADAGVVGFEAMEPFEDAVELVVRNALTVVVDFEAKATVLSRVSDLHRLVVR